MTLETVLLQYRYYNITYKVPTFVDVKQELLKKHETFETDLVVHQGRINDMEEDGQKLIQNGNYQAKHIEQRLKQLKVIFLY